MCMCMVDGTDQHVSCIVYVHANLSLLLLRLLLPQGCNYSSVLATPDCKTLYATGSDKKIKEFEDSMVGRTSPL